MMRPPFDQGCHAYIDFIMTPNLNTPTLGLLNEENLHFQCVLSIINSIIVIECLFWCILLRLTWVFHWCLLVCLRLIYSKINIIQRHDILLGCTLGWWLYAFTRVAEVGNMLCTSTLGAAFAFCAIHFHMTFAATVETFVLRCTCTWMCSLHNVFAPTAFYVSLYIVPHRYNHFPTIKGDFSRWWYRLSKLEHVCKPNTVLQFSRLFW